MASLLLIARPLSSDGKFFVNSFNSDSSGPMSTSGQFRRIERIAWVAQALFITCEN